MGESNNKWRFTSRVQPSKSRGGGYVPKSVVSPKSRGFPKKISILGLFLSGQTISLSKKSPAKKEHSLSFAWREPGKPNPKKMNHPIHPITPDGLSVNWVFCDHPHQSEVYGIVLFG